MKMNVEELPDGIKKVELVGRLDIVGTQAIDQPFSIATTTRAEPIAVDLSGVSFIASIGVRTLLSAARALALRGGKMVIFGPTPMVRKVLETVGVDHLVPLVADLDAARAVLVSR
jgi:anti-anti-sigma factor